MSIVYIIRPRAGWMYRDHADDWFQGWTSEGRAAFQAKGYEVRIIEGCTVGRFRDIIARNSTAGIVIASEGTGYGIGVQVDKDHIPIGAESPGVSLEAADLSSRGPNLRFFGIVCCNVTPREVALIAESLQLPVSRVLTPPAEFRNASDEILGFESLAPVLQEAAAILPHADALQAEVEAERDLVSTPPWESLPKSIDATVTAISRDDADLFTGELPSTPGPPTRSVPDDQASESPRRDSVATGEALMGTHHDDADFFTEDSRPEMGFTGNAPGSNDPGLSASRRDADLLDSQNKVTHRDQTDLSAEDSPKRGMSRDDADFFSDEHRGDLPSSGGADRPEFDDQRPSDSGLDFRHRPGLGSPNVGSDGPPPGMPDGDDDLEAPPPGADSGNKFGS